MLDIIVLMIPIYEKMIPYFIYLFHYFPKYKKIKHFKEIIIKKNTSDQTIYKYY